MANYCFADLPDFVQVQCNDYKVGGGSAIAFLETDQTSITDFTSASEWNAAIAAGEATVVKDIKIDFPAGSPATQENPVGCGPENIIVGFDFTLTYSDANVSADNDAAYAAIRAGRDTTEYPDLNREALRRIARETDTLVDTEGREA